MRVRSVDVTSRRSLLTLPLLAAAWTLTGSSNVSAAPVDESSTTPPQAERVFPEPESLRPAMDFWKSVFFTYGTDYSILHDREQHIVWRVVKLPTRKSGAVDSRAASKVINEEITDLKGRLKRLARTGKALDTADDSLLLAAGDIKHLQGAHGRIRSQKGIANNVRKGVEKARKWLPKIHQILEEEGVPPEIAALPFVESGFNPTARSGAGAAGLWQLMPATARGLGLKVDDTVDERLDIPKATRAAAKMLRQNYKMLGSWPLAITGYNHGPYGVKRAVKAVGSTDLTKLIESYRKSTWGFASKNFYAEFLAVVEYLESDDDIGALALGRQPASPTPQEDPAPATP